jgi:hypothetical protein
MRSRILGNHVVATAEFREPDLDLAWKSGLTSTSRQVEVLLAA